MSRCDHFVHIYDANDIFIDTLAGIIRGDAIRAQTPLLVRSPTSDAATDVDAIAGKMA